jgi:hypothetical protein
LHRKDKALAETAALLVLAKNLGGLPHGRGRMTRLEDRQILAHDIIQARADGAAAVLRLLRGEDLVSRLRRDGGDADGVA